MPHRETLQRCSPPRSAAQEGSAYMIVLMLLFVLTIVGVSLSVVTQTEIIVGSNERSIQRVFYAAESGIALATARILDDNNNLDGFAFDVKGSASNTAIDQNAVDRISVYPIPPIDDDPCQMCMINEDRRFLKINHAVVSEAVRLIGETGSPKDPIYVLEQQAGGGTVSTSTDGSPVASKSLTVMVEIQPLREPDDLNILLISPDPAVRNEAMKKFQF